MKSKLDSGYPFLILQGISELIDRKGRKERVRLWVKQMQTPICLKCGKDFESNKREKFYINNARVCLSCFKKEPV